MQSRPTAVREHPDVAKGIRVSVSAVLKPPGGCGKRLTSEQVRDLRRVLRQVRGMQKDEVLLWEAFWKRTTKDAEGVISREAGLTRARRAMVQREAQSWFRDGSAEWLLRWLGLEPWKARELAQQSMRQIGIANETGQPDPQDEIDDLAAELDRIRPQRYELERRHREIEERIKALEKTIRGSRG